MYWLVKRLIKLSRPRSKRKILNYVLESEIERYVFHNLKRHDYYPADIIDVGAFEGEWTRRIKTIFPSSRVLMVEPLAKESYLSQVQTDWPDVSYSIQLLGSKTGTEKRFYECETGSSYYEENSSAAKRPTVRETQSLDDLLSSLNYVLRSPSLLKIDSQGSELDILDGAQQSLSFFEFIYLEVPIVLYNHDAPDFEAYINYMARIGYRVFDVSTHHSTKKLLVQVDIMFLKKDSHFAKACSEALKD